jgi:hypothetical protein
VCIISLSYQESYPRKLTLFRCFLAFFNVVILSGTLLTFEIGSFLADTANYITSFWNQNDICLYFMTIAVFILEARILILHRDNLEEDYGLNEETFIFKEELPSGLRFLKKAGK